ncbi:MAG: hypothetical protein HYS57_02505 [Parcubacteria group bacterium]|nr:hypothetical protein [Parcubacteria group bacterium]
MPYVEQKDREKLDPLIDELAGRVVEAAKAHGYDGAFAGLLNYVATRLALKIVRIQFGKMRYWIIAVITGTFKNVADEFYRRVAIPYENKQIKKNSDVDFYREYDEEIEKM